MSKYDFVKKRKYFDNYFCRILKINKQKKTNATILNCDEWDSINHINIIFKMEDIFDCKISNKEIKTLNDYKKIISCVKKKVNFK